MSFQLPNGDVVIGAGVPLNTLIKFLEDQASVVAGYKVLADHVRKVKVDHTFKNITIPAMIMIRIMIHVHETHVIDM